MKYLPWTLAAILFMWAITSYLGFFPTSSDKAAIACSQADGHVYFVPAGACVRGAPNIQCYVLTCEVPMNKIVPPTATSTATTTTK